MGNIISLKNYRKDKRQAYLRSNREKLSAFLENFIKSHLSISFEALHELYLARQVSNNEQAWDYLDLRDTLREAITNSFGDLLRQELAQTRWYNPNLLSADEMIDQVLSAYILGNNRAMIS